MKLMNQVLMTKFVTQYICIWLLLGWAAGSWGKTHVVIVKDNSFNPATIIIEAGDTVRWVNEGPSAHNIYAVGRFRCANGCEADGGNGNPSSKNWISEVTFRVPETIPYECQPHVGFGMVGTVVVQTPTTATTHEISAESDNTFVPDDLTIEAGDVVYFSNNGGEHNFRAVDDSLICADGCQGDGQLTTTSPTGFPWEFYVRFNQPMEVPYYCSNPSHSQQTGILRINSDVLFIDDFE